MTGNTKRLLAMVLVLMLMLPAIPAATAQSEQITLRLAWWGGQSRHDKMLQIADEYMKQNPNVTIECEYTGDYFTKLTAQLAAGVEPDIYWVDINSAALFIEKGALLPMDDYVGNGLDLSNVSDAVTDTGRSDGHLYGIPNGVNASVMLYDPDIFAQLGIEAPGVDWTWDDFEAICKRCVDELHIYGVEGPFTTNVNFHYYLRSHGYEWYAEDGKSLAFTDPKVVEDFFAMSLRWQQNGYCPSQDVIAQKLGVEDTLMTKGQAAMMFTDSNQITTQSTVAGKPLAFLPLPGSGSNMDMFIKPSCFTVISANTKHPEQCVDFLNYFVNDLTAGTIFNGEVGVPASNKTREYLLSTLSGNNQIILQRQFDIIDLVSGHSSPINLIYPSKHGEVVDLLTDIQEKVMYEVESPAEAAQEFMNDANRILASD